MNVQPTSIEMAWGAGDCTPSPDPIPKNKAWRLHKIPDTTAQRSLSLKKCHSSSQSPLAFNPVTPAVLSCSAIIFAAFNLSVRSEPRRAGGVRALRESRVSVHECNHLITGIESTGRNTVDLLGMNSRMLCAHSFDAFLVAVLCSQYTPAPNVDVVRFGQLPQQAFALYRSFRFTL